MAGKDEFEGRTRARVGRAGRSAPSLGVIAALLGAGLLLLLVLAGSLDAPAAPAVAVLPATPTPAPTPSVLPTPAAPAIPNLVYLATSAGAILVVDQGGAPAYQIAGRDFALSADYGTLFVVGDGALSAHDSSSGFELWRATVANIRESRPGLPSPVIPRPDGAAVGVISEQRLPDGSHATYQTFHQIDAHSGEPITEPFDLIGWNGSDAPFFSADGRRLVVPGDSDDVLLLDPSTGVRVGQLELDSPTIAIWPLPDTDSFVWVSAQAVDHAVSDDHGVNVTLLDSASLRQIDTFRIELPARHWPTLLGAVSADGRLALRLLEEPADAADLTLANLTNYLVVADLRGARPSPRRSLERQVSAMAFDSQSDALYVAYAPAAGAGAALARLIGERFDPQPLLALGDAEVVRLAVGPGSPVFVSPGPFEFLPDVATARPLDQPPFDRSVPAVPSEPMPFILPLTRTNTFTISAEIGHGGTRIFTAQSERRGQHRDIAWLSVPTVAGFDVVSIDASGASTSRARGVAAAIARAQAPPWLLIRQADGWVLRDPADGRETPLQLPAGSQPQGCVAAPDGQRLACQSSPTTLALISMADGSVRMLETKTAGTLDLPGGIPLRWSAAGIYGYSLSAGSRLLWRVDPDQDDPALAILLAIPEADRFALSSDGAEDRVLYTLTASRELRFRNLATGRERLLAQDLAPAGGMASLSPDGRFAAYARHPEGSRERDGYDVIVINLDSGERLIHATGLTFVASSWRWSQAGDRLLYRVLEPPGSPQRERIVVVDVAAGAPQSDLPLPGHTVAGVEFGADGMAAALIYEGMVADLVLLAADGRSQRLGMAYPLGASRPTLFYVP
jgi:hypothetical protein